MASLLNYWSPVLYWLNELQNSVIDLGVAVCDQARASVGHVCRQSYDQVTEVYHKMKKKPTSTYEKVSPSGAGVTSHHKSTGDIYQDVQEKASTIWHQWINNISLASILSSLRINLIFNRIRFEMSFAFKDLKNKFKYTFTDNLEGFFSRKDQKNKTSWKKKVSDKAKSSLEKLNRITDDQGTLRDRRKFDFPETENQITFPSNHEPIYEDLIETGFKKEQTQPLRRQPTKVSERGGLNEDEEEFEEISDVIHDHEERANFHRAKLTKIFQPPEKQMEEPDSSGSNESLEIMRIMSAKERMALMETRYAAVKPEERPPLPPPRLGRRSVTPSSGVGGAPGCWTPVPPCRRRRGSVSSQREAFQLN